jgi:23S rRNA pseudouridine2457 synthase
MVSQFVSPVPVRLLGDLDFEFPEGTHAIGRLDSDSEGLLILTTNKEVTQLLFCGEKPHTRTYLVRVKGRMTANTLKRLQTGVPIRISGDDYYVARPTRAEIVERPAYLADRPGELPIDAPQTWLLMTLTEGKYHQVRKMVGVLKHRCQRLIRVSIENLTLEGLQPGEVRELNEHVFFQQLNILYPTKN